MVVLQYLNCEGRSWALSSKELFALSAAITLAAGAPKAHLLAASLSAVEMGLSNIR